MLLIPNWVSAQQSSGGSEDELAIVQAIWKKAKRDLIKEYMKLDSTEGVAFWKVYDKYENSRKGIINNRLNILKDYADEYKTLNDAEAINLANRAIKNKLAAEKLNKKYLKRFSKAIGGKGAAKFMQLENYIQTVISSSIQEQLPFIDELQEAQAAALDM